MALEIDRSLRLPKTEYLLQRHKKSLIVLHHTVGGSARSTFEWWRTDSTKAGKPSRIGTAYLIERDGTIYEIFPPECWAWHLGLKGTRGAVDKRSIGIELCNEGPLINRAEWYYCFGRVSERTRYQEEVYDHGNDWRGQYRYFAVYPKRQVRATAALLRKLIEDFMIPSQTPRNHLQADLARYQKYRGVLGHAHLRTDKTDPHPGFPWKEIISACGLQLTA